MVAIVRFTIFFRYYKKRHRNPLVLAKIIKYVGSIKFKQIRRYYKKFGYKQKNFQVVWEKIIDLIWSQEKNGQ